MKHIKRISPGHRVAVIAESAHGSGTSQAGVHLTKPHLYSVNICFHLLWSSSRRTPMLRDFSECFLFVCVCMCVWNLFIFSCYGERAGSYVAAFLL